MYRRIRCYNAFAKQVLHSLMTLMRLPAPEKEIPKDALFYFTEEGWKEYGSVIWMVLEDLTPKAEMELVEVPINWDSEEFEEIDCFQVIRIDAQFSHSVDNWDFWNAQNQVTNEWFKYIGRVEDFVTDLVKSVCQQDNQGSIY